MKRINVLMIISSLDRANGVTSYVMNYYRNMYNINMDFVVTSDNIKNEFYTEIINNGNNVFFIESNRLKKILKSIKNIKNFLKKNAHKYDIIHCNVANIGLIFLYYAKKYGMKNRIIHSHATVTAETFLHKLRNQIIIPITVSYANNLFACSNAAGKAMFGEKSFFIVNNAIDSKKYFYSKKNRKQIRNEFKINDNTLVIGNIGRISNQKNHSFMLELIEKMKNENIILLLVGNGPNEDIMKKRVADRGLENKILFLGSRKDTYKLYSGFDIFILPSLFEGLPVVGIEAQTNGIPCIFSQAITKEAKISNNVEFLDIGKDNYNDWIKCINQIQKQKRNKSKIYDKYDIKKNAEKMEQKYFEIVGD